eukprot:1162078-Pelagomonas_calceolata.AAC.2
MQQRFEHGGPCMLNVKQNNVPAGSFHDTCWGGDGASMNRVGDGEDMAMALPVVEVMELGCKWAMVKTWQWPVCDQC